MKSESAFTIIPIRLEDCSRGDMRLTGWQQYDLFEDWEGTLDTLAVNLGGCSLSDAGAKDERTEEEKMIETLKGKGITLYYAGEYDRAYKMFEVVIEIKAEDPSTWFFKGAALWNLGRQEEALEACNKAIELKPDFPEAWFHKGRVFNVLGRCSGQVNF